jgi:hypothetical protein
VLANWRVSNSKNHVNNQSSQQEGIDHVTQHIDYSVSALVSGSSENPERRLQHLRQIVQSAASLAIDLEQQRANFVFERPKSALFDSATMEDVLQEKKPEELRRHAVQSIVFPAVVRYGNNEGADYETRTVILKAAVLV